MKFDQVVHDEELKGPITTAVNVTGKYFAFAQKDDFDVYVFSFEKGQQKTAKFSMSSAVQGLDFARLFEEIILAAIDDLGNIKVVSLLEDQRTKQLEIQTFIDIDFETDLSKPTAHHQIKFCPYMQEDQDDDEENAFVLAAVNFPFGCQS